MLDGDSAPKFCRAVSSGSKLKTTGSRCSETQTITAMRRTERAIGELGHNSRLALWNVGFCDVPIGGCNCRMAGTAEVADHPDVSRSNHSLLSWASSFPIAASTSFSSPGSSGKPVRTILPIVRPPSMAAWARRKLAALIGP